MIGLFKSNSFALGLQYVFFKEVNFFSFPYTVVVLVPLVK